MLPCATRAAGRPPRPQWKVCSSPGKSRSAHVGRERLGGVAERAPQVGVVLDEAREGAPAEPGHVLPDQHLPVAVDARADADGGDHQLGGHPLGDVGGHHLQHDREGARVLQGQGGAHQLVTGVAAALHPVAPELVLALRREADVRHDRHAGVDQRPHLRRRPARRPRASPRGADPSFMKRTDVSSACAGDTWYDPKGRSATTIDRWAPRATARTSGSSSSTVTGSVVS